MDFVASSEIFLEVLRSSELGSGPFLRLRKGLNENYQFPIIASKLKMIIGVVGDAHY